MIGLLQESWNLYISRSSIYITTNNKETATDRTIISLSSPIRDQSRPVIKKRLRVSGPILNNPLLLFHKAVELHGYIHGPLTNPPYAPLTHHSFLYAVSRPCSRHRGEMNTQIQKVMPITCRLGFIYPSPSYPQSFISAAPQMGICALQT